MNICMFTNTYLPHVGGVANSVAAFTEDLLKAGHRLLVVAPAFDDEADEERQEEILRVPAIQNFNGSDFSVRVAVPFLIANRINEFRPDIIHSHHPYLLGDAALRTALRKGLPLVFTHHTLYEQYTHYVPFDSDAMGRFVIHLSTQYANLCTRVIAPSRSVAELVRKRGVTAPLDEIPTGVDLGFFEKGDGTHFRKALGMDRRTPVIGHVGRLAPEKNLRYLAQGVALFLKEHDGNFLLVGEGPSKDDIREIFRKERLTGRLFLTGQLTGRELSDAYGAMDVFAFSSMTETQGMVLVEAMAAGLPVIALDASGSREVVRDGRNGRLLREDASPENFAGALGEWATDTENAERWARAAARTAASFSRERCARKLIQTYRSAVSRHPGPVRNAEELIPWDRLLGALKAEWVLITEKAAAAIASLTGDREAVPSPEAEHKEGLGGA